MIVASLLYSVFMDDGNKLCTRTFSHFLIQNKQFFIVELYRTILVEVCFFLSFLLTNETVQQKKRKRKQNKSQFINQGQILKLISNIYTDYSLRFLIIFARRLRIVCFIDR